MAISGASVTATAPLTRWTGATAGNVVTEGGNITNTNISSATLTDKWADFFGNVTGSIVLKENTSALAVYTWSWAGTGGYVCLSENTAFPFASSSNVSLTDVGAMNTAYGHNSAADNATNTFTTTSCNVSLVEATILRTANVTLQGNSSFTTCALKDTATSAKTDFSFCTAINATGANYKNTTVAYEVMVPTQFGPSLYDTYYFYVQLN